MEMKILIHCLFLFVLVSGQSGVHKSYDWRTSGRLQNWPKLTSLLPYEHPMVTDTHPAAINHAAGYHDSSSAYQDDSRPYQDDSRPYPVDPYSSEYHNPSPYQYANHVDQSLSSYEHPYASQEELNMTMVRIGGFAGSGDTRGFGAYDFPKNNHESTDQDSPRLQKELTDLLKISRHHRAGYHNPMLMHPLPPPL